MNSFKILGMSGDRETTPIYIKAYLDLFGYISQKRIEKKDTDFKEIHAHLIAVLTTGVLMWTYALIAIFTISNPLAGYVGIVASSIHLLSPLLFRHTKNTFFICSLMLGVGVIHQSTFSFYSGGFNSMIIIWFSVIPLLAGLIAGKRAALVWGAIVFIVASVFLFLELTGFDYPYLISSKGEILARSVIVFGYILLSTVLIFGFLHMSHQYQESIKSERDRVINLVRVLSHDLSNPLLIIENYIKRILRKSESEDILRYAQKVNHSVEAMKDIAGSVRNMQALSEGKYKLNIKPTSLNECISYIKFLLEDSLDEKEVVISYDYHKNRDTYIYVDPVVFKNQVLANILSNAIKFSERGGAINIDIEVCPQNHGELKIHISDKGVGMSEEIVSQVFQSDKPTSRKGTAGESGTGYGMLIVKSFVEKFDGGINIRSTEKSDHCKDHGTIVTLSLQKCENIDLH